MIASQFNEQIARMVSAYGKAAFPPDRIALVWREFEKVDAESFRSMVDRWIGEFRQAPMLPEMRNLLSEWRERSWNREKKEASTFVPNTIPSCRLCRDGGVYLCVKGDDPAPWAFRCHCPKGCEDPRRNIPQFKQAHADMGFRFKEMGGA